MVSYRIRSKPTIPGRRDAHLTNRPDQALSGGKLPDTPAQLPMIMNRHKTTPILIEYRIIRLKFTDRFTLNRRFDYLAGNRQQ